MRWSRGVLGLPENRSNAFFRPFAIAMAVFACMLLSLLAIHPTAVSAQESDDQKMENLAEQTYRGDSVGYLAASIYSEFIAQNAVEEPHVIPVVSGNEELDAQLDFILETIVGRDEDALFRAYEWIGSYDTFPYLEMDYIPADVPWEEWSVPCALQMVRMGSGNCYRYAALMCWVARALGYDARAVIGEVMVTSGWAFHGWVEVDVDGETFIIDPQQHARPVNEGMDFFMVSYDEAPLYYDANVY